MEQNKMDGLPEGWEKNELGKLLKVQNGYAFDAVNFSDTEGFPLIRIRDLKNSSTQLRYKGDWDEKFKVSNGDLLIGMDGEFRCYEWKGGHALLNQRVCRLQDINPGLSRKFLLYGINSHLQEIEEKTAFVTVKHISSKQINSIQFPLPPLPEQERIVAKLDGIFEHVDSSIRLLEQNLADIDAMEASVLDEAFNREALPERWPMRRLEDLSECLDYLRRPVKHTDRVAGKYPYYGASGVVDYVDKFIFSEKLILLGEDGAKWGAGDNSAFIADGEYWVNNHAHIIRPNRSIIKDEYLVHFLVHADLKDYITGTTVPKLNQEKMRSILIPLPPLPEQERIVAKLDAFFSEQKAAKAKYESQIAELRALKSSILSSAFRGEI